MRFGAIELEIESLENLERTIDDLFAYLLKEGNPSLLEELCPYFGEIWPSARALAGHLARLNAEQAWGPGLEVLELGCGLAVPSLVAARLGARVLATDFHPEVERFLRRNLALNHIESVVHCRLNWQSPDESERLRQACSEAKGYDWIIGSDILYERQHPTQVAQVIDQQLSPQGTAIIADPARAYLQSFVDEMRERGFVYETLVEKLPEKEVFLVTLKRGPQKGG